MNQDTANKKVLFIGYVWPEPKSSAAGTNIVSLIKLFIEQGYHVTFASPAQESPHQYDLASLKIDCQPIALNCASFDKFVKSLMPDVVIFDRFMMEEQFSWRVKAQCPDAIRILNSEDLHSVRNTRHQCIKAGETYSAHKLKQSDNELVQRELSAIYRADLTLIISPVEIKLLEETFNINSQYLQYMPFMLDSVPNEVKAQQANFENRTGFISIGNFRHAPNWDAVLQLKQTYWPAIRKYFKSQGIEPPALNIYGAYTPPKAQQLHNPNEGFYIRGWADCAFDVMQQARVCLAPLRFGAGIKGKLADAFMCGTPNVTTEIGQEGMLGFDSLLDWPGFISHTPEAFAKNAFELYQNAELWQQKQLSGYRVVEQVFDKQTIGPNFVDKLNQITLNLSEHRANNFIGNLLSLQIHKSTQYMAQWIEAKNKLADERINKKE
ncbi:glycosyltransferase [Marinifaba aquimaris]|uniref:glycosyltransferase n=1 Tax=Marinifaba aquimaris TaxID=2741323 RepID=UPI0031B57272